MILDLYAGPGGWDEGMRQIGITDVIGVEWEPSACATAKAAGHTRIRADVSRSPIRPGTPIRGLVASPPCQAWSMAGKRAGEQDRTKAHHLINAYAAGRDDIGDGWADDRSHHAAQPVRWVRDFRPTWVCFEQVPPVLGLWQHASDALRRWGYSTWTGVLNSADYGVPQTRERAVLMARLDKPVHPPAPTHAQHPEGADLFGGELLPWVSMADALGWEGIDRPARTVCGDRSPRWAYGQGNSYATGWTLDRRTIGRGPRGSRVPVALVAADRPAPTLTSQGKPAWVHGRPATTLAGDPRIAAPGHRDRAGGERQHDQSIRIAVAEAAILQSFPADYPWQGNKTAQFLQVGNAVPPRLAAAIVRAATS